MNIHFHKTLFVLLISLFALSCNQEKYEPDLPEVNTPKTTKLTLSTSLINIKHEYIGTEYIDVTSDTDWVVSIDNPSRGGINGLEVSPLRGNGNATISVKYGSVGSMYHDPMGASIDFWYYSEGSKKNKTVTIRRWGRFN